MSILIPVLVVPYSKEITLTEQSYFLNGSDIKIKKWNMITGMSEEEIRSLEGVVSVTNVQLYPLIEASSKSGLCRIDLPS